MGYDTCVVLDDDELSSNEDEPLQKRLRQLSSAARTSGSGPAPTTPDVASTAVATADKEAVDKRAAEEAAVMRAAEEAAVTRATEKAAANKEATDKSTADEATVKGATIGATGDSPAPGQAPSLVAGTKRAVAPSGFWKP
jgi:hypothetical protein